MLSVRLQIAIISTRWSTKLARFVPHSTQSSEVECIDSILWKSTRFVPRSSTVEKINSIPPHHRSLREENETWPCPVEEWFPPVPKFRLQVVWMIESVFSTVWIKSIFSTVDDQVERGTNRLDFLHLGWSVGYWDRMWVRLSLVA